MADHRAEQVLVALTAQVTGLATTGAKVYRGRSWPLADADLPGLLVYMGPDREADPPRTVGENMDAELEVSVEARVKTASEGVDTALNRVRQEVEVAIGADRTLGLGFVRYVEFVEAGPPDFQADTEKPTASLPIRYLVHYRRNYADPSQ